MTRKPDVFDGDGGNRTRVKSLPKEVCGLRGDCVPWVGATNSSGYGARTINGEPWLAHRAAYVEAYGEIPAAAQIHHVCENRLCVNRDHLEALSPLDHNRSHLPRRSGAQIIEAILERRDEFWRDDAIELAEAIGSSEAAISKALVRLKAAGRIEQVGHGVYRRTAA